MTNAEIFYNAYVAELAQQYWGGERSWNLLETPWRRAFEAGTAALERALKTPVGSDARDLPSPEPRRSVIG